MGFMNWLFGKKCSDCGQRFRGAADATVCASCEELNLQVAEEARQKAAQEAKRKLEEEARQKAAQEAKRKLEEEARQKAAQESRRKTEEEVERRATDQAEPDAAVDDSPESAGEGGAAMMYGFISSGNPSVTSTYYDLLDPNGVQAMSPTALYALNVSLYAVEHDSAFDAAIDLAGKNGAPFNGVEIFSDEEPIQGVADVLSGIRSAGFRQTHVTFVFAPHVFRSEIVGIFKEIRDQAGQQGILPFPMFITTDSGAARAVLAPLSLVKTAKQDLQI